MAKVRVLSTSYINDMLMEPGVIIEDYQGAIGSNLENLDPKDKAAVTSERETVLAEAAALNLEVDKNAPLEDLRLALANAKNQQGA